MLLPETLRVHDRESFDFRYGYFLPHKGQVAEDLRELGVTVDCFSRQQRENSDEGRWPPPSGSGGPT